MPVLHLNEQGLDKLLESGALALVDFWADWCGPCKMLAPVIDQLAEDYDGKVVVGKVNIDDQGALAMRYGVMSIPTVVLFKDGLEVERKVGVLPAEVFRELLDENL